MNENFKELVAQAVVENNDWDYRNIMNEVSGELERARRVAWANVISASYDMSAYSSERLTAALERVAEINELLAAVENEVAREADYEDKKRRGVTRGDNEAIASE